MINKSCDLRRNLIIALMLVNFLVFSANVVRAQGYGNSISGRVTGVDRRPISDLYVELLDSLSRPIARTRTNGVGLYNFSGIGSGRFTVRVLTVGTDYEEEENSVEIYNITPQAASNEQSDFNLKLRKGAILASPASLFVQDVPSQAKENYEKALSEFESKKNNEAQESLRRAIDIFPRYYDALERLGIEYIRMDKPHTYKASQVLFSAAVDVNPRGYRSWYGLAFAGYSLGEYASALPAIEKAVELQPAVPEAVFLSGTLMRHNHKFANAEKQLLRAVELSHDSIPRAHWELALLYGNNLKRYADAAKELKLFLKAQPAAKDAEKIKQLIADFESKAQKSR